MKKALMILGIFLCLVFALRAEEKKPTEEKKSSENAQSTKPKPYGCFRDLKWGMSFEEAQTSLGVKLKRTDNIAGPPDAYRGDADVEVGKKTYPLMLLFDKTGLIAVKFNTKENEYSNKDASDKEKVQSLIDFYNAFYGALKDKFGKPTKENVEDRGSDLNIVDNIIAHKASYYSFWETEESTITLRVELFVKGSYCYSGTCVKTFEWPLVYEKKTPKQDEKLQL